MAVEDVHLDGRTLEGGGQLLRLALSLSCLTGQGVHVTNIRGNRSKGRGRPVGKAGGMKKSHLECVKWLASATNANTEGMTEGSSELRFQPQPTDHVSLWTDIRSGGRLVRQEATIRLTTPGSIYLILQALLPYILFGPCLQAEDEHLPIPIRLTVIGGTNVSTSPSHEYTAQVLLPTLANHLKVLDLKATLHKRGWSSAGSTELGEVQFDVTPLRRGSAMDAFVVTGRGKLTGFDVTVIAHPLELREEIMYTMLTTLAKQWPDVEANVAIDEDSGKRYRVYALVVAKFGSGDRLHRLGRDCLYDGRSRSKGLAKEIVETTLKGIREEIAHGGCIDEHMQDQLVVFQALSAGSSRIDRGFADHSLHAQTARWVATQFLPSVSFEGDSCKGIGFVPAIIQPADET